MFVNSCLTPVSNKLLENKFINKKTQKGNAPVCLQLNDDSL